MFTDFVRQLDPSGTPPDQEVFATIWGQLRRLLERELRRRGVWDMPPSFLGIYGRPRWHEGGGEAASGLGIEDGLGELVAEFYSHIFIDRLSKLVSYLQNRPTIDGLVVVSARHFLHERQKKHDPLGYRVFEIFHQAVSRAVAAKEWFILDGGSRIRNETVLGCREGLEIYPIPQTPLDKVGEWNDTLLPELVEGKGRAREWVVESLRTFLGRLPAEGIDLFVFRDLLNPLKKNVRLRWAARLDLSQGEKGAVASLDSDEKIKAVPLVHPDSGVEDRQSLEKLDECLAAVFDRLEPDRTRDDLQILWKLLYDRAQKDEIPSQRKLAEELKLPRRRLAKLFDILGTLFEDCRSTIPLGIGGVNSERKHGLQEAQGRVMSLASQIESLRKKTGRARRGATEGKLSIPSDERPMPGDLFLMPETGDIPIEWFLLRENSVGFHAIPADLSPVAGPGDIRIPKAQVGGPLTLRCSLGLNIPTSEFEAGVRIGTLPPEILEKANQFADSSAEPIEDRELEVWIRDVVEPARKSLSLQTGGVVRRFSPPPKASRSMAGRFLGLAAAVLFVVCIGLVMGILRQNQTILQLEEHVLKDNEPVGNIPFRSIIFSVDSERNHHERIVLPDEAEELFLILNVAEVSRRPSDRYRLKILNAKNQAVFWTSEPLNKENGASLTVQLPVRNLSEGDYLFLLYRIETQEEVFLTERSFRIEYRR